MQPRPEHPKPTFERKKWLNLNGKDWEFSIQRAFLTEAPDTWEGKIKVPFCLQSELSGALNQLSSARRKSLGLEGPPLAPGLGHREALWYRRPLVIPATWRNANVRVHLHVGACDSAATVIVNGNVFPEHRGGSTSFHFDITDALCPKGKENVLLLKCTDRAEEGGMQPCGKQHVPRAYPGPGPHVPTLYSNITGIWQTVWLEAVPARGHLKRVQIVPRCSEDAWSLELKPDLCSSCDGLTFEATLLTSRVARKMPLVTGRVAIGKKRTPELTLKVPKAAVRLWSPQDPYLYGLRLRLYEGSRIIDEVDSYTALRTVRRVRDEILLNGQPVYLRMVLDQGYYPDGLWTAPSEAALRKDIQLAMDLGFNGARLHQKVFEPLYFKHADELGFLVIAEYPDWNGGFSSRWEVTDEYRETVDREWGTVVADLHNHPSIIAWGVFNEFGPKNGHKYNTGAGGGFWSRYPPARRTAIVKKHYDFVRQVVSKVRKHDLQRRPVHDSSGWIHVDTDIWSFHEYKQNPEKFGEILQQLPAKFVDGHKGQPMFVAEYAGVGIDLGGPYGKNPKRFTPGYPGASGLPKTAAEALERIGSLTAEIYKVPNITGFCCTQLYDVEHEKNGLLLYDRKPKFSKSALRHIFDGRGQKGRWKLATGASEKLLRARKTITKKKR